MIYRLIGFTDMENDIINNPSHYCESRTYEPIAVIKDWKLNFNLGNVVKYISRAGRKGNALEDLRKAKFYLDWEIQYLNHTNEDMEETRDIKSVDN